MDTVAIEASLLLQTPPPDVLDKVADEPVQIEVVPESVPTEAGPVTVITAVSVEEPQLDVSV